MPLSLQFQNLKVMIIRSYDKILNIEINSRRPSLESPPSWHAECILGGETGAAQTEIPYRGFESLPLRQLGRSPLFSARGCWQ
jgi:hypothetical protein